MPNKQISHLPKISANNFDKNSDCVLAQLNGDYPTFLAAVQNATEAAQNSASLTMFNDIKHITDVPTVGEDWHRSRTSYDLKPYGVPSSATAAYLDFKQVGQAYPKLMFIYFKNSTEQGRHLFRFSYDRAMERNPYLWVPVSDGKIYISWVGLYHGGG